MYFGGDERRGSFQEFVQVDLWETIKGGMPGLKGKAKPLVRTP